MEAEVTVVSCLRLIRPDHPMSPGDLDCGCFSELDFTLKSLASGAERFIFHLHGVHGELLAWFSN